MPLQMDNIAAELTCAQGCRAGRVYVGAADGSVLAIAANRAGELPLAHARWGLRVCARAVTVRWVDRWIPGLRAAFERRSRGCRQS